MCRLLLLLLTTVTNKRTIIKISGSSKSEESLPNVKSPVKISSKTSIIPVEDKNGPAVKVKTFQEIMAEKRQRRFGKKEEVLVISDDNDSSAQKVPVDRLQQKSAQVKLELR